MFAIERGATCTKMGMHFHATSRGCSRKYAQTQVPTHTHSVLTGITRVKVTDNHKTVSAGCN